MPRFRQIRFVSLRSRSVLRAGWQGFLDAAAELFVEVGYEAATMTAVAERSRSSIGALYNYFPDKQSIAFTLVNQYSQEMEAHWKPLMEQAEILTPCGVRRSVHRAHHPIRPGASRLPEPAGRAHPLSPRPCRPKGFTSRDRNRLSGKESIGFRRNSLCSQRTYLSKWSEA